MSGSNSTIMISGAVLRWKGSILYEGRGDGDACHEYATCQDYLRIKYRKITGGMGM